MLNTDIVIIGAGPAGLFAGFYSGMRSMNAIIIDPLEMTGGRLSALYPEKYIYDVAGFEKIKAQELVNNLTNQLKRFEQTTEIKLKEQVENIEKTQDGFIVTTNKSKINCKAVIIAAGSGSFSPRLLGVENENIATNIHYFVDALAKFKDKNVVIFGGGDSAVDWSLMLENIAKSVNIVHRRDEFRAHSHSVDMLKQSNVNIFTPFTPESINLNEQNAITSVVIKSKDAQQEIIVDDVIVNFGFVAKLGQIENWGINVEAGKIPVDSAQRTNVDGIFAIGDICKYEGKADLIITGFGEAPIAVNGAFQIVNPDATLGILHSSSVIKEENGK